MSFPRLFLLLYSSHGRSVHTACGFISVWPVAAAPLRYVEDCTCVCVCESFYTYFYTEKHLHSVVDLCVCGVLVAQDRECMRFACLKCPSSYNNCLGMGVIFVMKPELLEIEYLIFIGRIRVSYDNTVTFPFFFFFMLEGAANYNCAY